MEKQSCPTCGQSTNKRRVNLFSGMVKTLDTVYKWAKANGVHEFRRKDIKHLFENENDTARFGDWILFGGLVYRPPGVKKGRYGMNFKRIEDFMTGKTRIPMMILKDPLTQELEQRDYRFIHQIKNLSDFLDADGTYVPQYED